MTHRPEERAAARPAGLRVLVPGYPQWSWGQRERSAALAGTYAAAMVVGLFAWGSRLGLAMMALAYLAHVSSASDAIRQAAFPGFGRWVPTVSASVGLGLGCYGPLLAMVSLMAWPDLPLGAEHERYAINRCAYRNAGPKSGDWVWYRSPDGAGFGLGRVVAAPAGEVEWSARGLTVDGRPLGWKPDTPGGAPLDLAMTVPDGHLLVAPAIPTPGTGSCGLRIVPSGDVVGRPWARIYPVWNRRLLL